MAYTGVVVWRVLLAVISSTTTTTVQYSTVVRNRYLLLILYEKPAQSLYTNIYARLTFQ